MKPIIGARHCNGMLFLMRANFIAARAMSLEILYKLNFMTN